MSRAVSAQLATRIPAIVLQRLKLYSVMTDVTVMAHVEAALTAYMNDHAASVPGFAEAWRAIEEAVGA